MDYGSSFENPQFHQGVRQLQKSYKQYDLDKVVKILKELVLKNKVDLKEHIREFPPLPRILALTELNKAIQEARGSMTLKDQLRDVVDGLNNENLNVRPCWK